MHLPSGRTAIIDCDPQLSTFKFFRTREVKGQTVPTYKAALNVTDLKRTASELYRQNDHIIIDVGGRDHNTMRGALLISSSVITPLRPSREDLDAFVEMLEVTDYASGQKKPGIIRAVRSELAKFDRVLPFVVVMNQCPTVYQNQFADRVSKGMKEGRYRDEITHVCQARFGARLAWQHSGFTYQSIAEVVGRSEPAYQEWLFFVNELRNKEII